MNPPSSGRRPASSASVRPPSSASSIRPSSRNSTRPSSSVSIRPSSSASSVKHSTLTSSSSRSESRTATRPPSRYAHRPSTRQSTRLLPLYESLVTHLTGLTADDDKQTNFHAAVDFVSKSLDQTTKPSGNVDMGTVEKQLLGHAQKARVNSHDTLGTALQEAQKRLHEEASRISDLDADIQVFRIPGHLQLLLALSTPPTRVTLESAEQYTSKMRNPDKAMAALTWQDILAEEPFEGQHWEGVYGLPSGNVVGSQSWGADSDGSTPSLSPWDDEDDTEQSSSSSEIELTDKVPDHLYEGEPDTRTWGSQVASYNHRYEVEEMQARQYWRPDWRSPAFLHKPFNIGDASTLGPAFRRLLGPGRVEGMVQDKLIHEHNAVREILTGLQGRRNLMIEWVNSGEDTMKFIPATSAPSLLQLTPASQLSILSSFAHTATTLEHLRRFVGAIFAHAARVPSTTGSSRLIMSNFSRRTTRTFEAFAEAIDAQVREFDSWCATQEESICMGQAGIGAPLVVSLLSTEQALRSRFSETFSNILNILQYVVQRCTRSALQPEVITAVWTYPDLPKRMCPAAITALLLDSLLQSIQKCSEMGDDITVDAMKRVFSDTAEPSWGLIHQWLRDGMPVQDIAPHPPSQVGRGLDGRQLDDEFIVEDNELPLLDPDFWKEGFVLRADTGETGNPGAEHRSAMMVPIFLQPIAVDLLEAGKALGLLRTLGVPLTLGQHYGAGQWMASWRSFKDVLYGPPDEHQEVSDEDASQVAGMASTDDFSSMVYDELIGPCRQAKESLSRVLADECDLWLHLIAMEGLYLMRRGDVMSNFVDVLFSRMDSVQPWEDFHFLNNAFQEICSSTKWIESSLVRFSHRGNKDKTVNRTVRAMEGLFIEYAVPFPLTYIWGPHALQTYSSIFVFVLQIRRAKRTLERILVRHTKVSQDNTELKTFYAMRGKLSWFVNVLLDFVCTNVLHAQVLAFHTAFKKASSLDEMIRIHDDHLGKLESRCLLQRDTAALHRAIISILDMALHFSDCFIAFAGDTTHDISRQSIVPMRKHRSRRQKRQRDNVIGFSDVLRQRPDASDSDSDSDGDEDLITAIEPSFSYATSSISFAEESFIVRLDKMSSELDALVRFTRRGVESLAGGNGGAASAFGMFAFTLEDWDQ